MFPVEVNTMKWKMICSAVAVRNSNEARWVDTATNSYLRREIRLQFVTRQLENGYAQHRTTAH